MRKLLLTLLLASAATSPAFAEPQHRDREDRQEARQERQQQREERQQAREVRAEQPRVERPEPRNFERSQPQVEARERRFNGGVNVDATARANRADIEQIRAAREDGRRQRADGTSRWTRDNNQQPGETGRWVRDPQQRAGETNRWTRDRTGWTGNGDQRQQWEQRQQWQQRQQTTQNRRWAGTWNRDWRNDRRYDWRRYRDQHRSTFRIGIYYDPFGYNYQRFNIGYRLSPAYYGQRYWFDAAMYGLPYPPPGTQWVRYWNDALLVDMYSGQVIDAIPDFFW